MGEKALQKLQRIYRALPKVNCKGLCHGSCGPIPRTPLENDSMTKANSGLPVVTTESDLTCPALKEGRCSIYESRPFICRIYGVAPGLLCPHGCVPERVLSEIEISMYRLR